MKYKKTKELVLSAMFLAMGIVLPLFTGKNNQLGTMFLPMHIPVFLCGLICGGKNGGIVGFIVPLLNFMIYGRPALYPKAVGMSFELATYGTISGVLYKDKKESAWLYIAMITAMIAGRIVWGVMNAILRGVAGEIFTFEMFVGTAIVEAIPGIIIQIALIPAIMSAIEFVKTKKEKRNDKISVQK